MIHEISQLDISDRQLLASNVRPSIWTEIGEAQITHTIFGRAKVRIIRKNDNYRRVFWLTGIVAAAIAAAALFDLFTPQPTEPQGEDLQPPASIKEHAIAPEFLPENSVSPAAPPALMKESIPPAQSVIDKPVVIQKSAAQTAQGLMSSETKAAKPVMPLPNQVTANQRTSAAQTKPVVPQSTAASQTVPLAAANAAKISTGTQPPARLLQPKPIVAPTVPSPAATKSVAQSAASSPVEAIQLSAPLLKEETQTPAADKQPAAPNSMQSK